MTIKFTYSTRMNIIFDEIFTVTFTGTIDCAKAIIEELVAKYGFETAIAVDTETGEIIMEAK